MGAIFAVFKKSPRQRYELGKHRRGFPPGAEPLDLMEKVSKLHASYAAIPRDSDMSVIHKMSEAAMPLTNPGWHAMWSIMDDPNYKPFKMSRWDRETLADKLYRGSQNIDSVEDALVVADDLLKWAGDADCVLMPDDHNADDFKGIGFPTRGYRDTGSIWEALDAS
jgi:hypothetical protein